MQKTDLLVGLMLLVSIFLAIFYYPALPDQMATHWGLKGYADGFSDKLIGTFLFPAILILLTALLYVLPKIDPMHRNAKGFESQYSRFIFVFSVFIVYIQYLSIQWNIGNRFDFTPLIPPAIGLLFISLGDLVSSAKQNWFIGIRTPWTLSNPRVWDKTHQVTGMLFKISGAIAIISIFVPDLVFWAMIIPAIITSLFGVLYSYYLFSLEGKAKPKKKKK